MEETGFCGENLGKPCIWRPMQFFLQYPQGSFVTLRKARRPFQGLQVYFVPNPGFPPLASLASVTTGLRSDAHIRGLRRDFWTPIYWWKLRSLPLELRRTQGNALGLGCSMPVCPEGATQYKPNPAPGWRVLPCPGTLKVAHFIAVYVTRSVVLN